MKQKFVQAALIACCISAAACKQAPTPQGSSEYPVLTAATTQLTIPINYSATIRGRQDIAIYPQVSGTITELKVKEGEVVSKGQALFVIDQVPYKAALQTAEANVQAAKAGVATAKLTHDSKKELFAKNIVSQFDLSMANNTMMTAEAQLAQAEAQRVSAANNFSYTVVKAPANGVVGTLPYRVGALVGPTIPQPLTTVSDNSEMYVYFSMTENQLLNLTRKYGSAAKTLKELSEVQLLLNDGSFYSQPGRIESISGVIDPSTGSVSLRAAFPNKERLLTSGSSGNVVLPTHYTDCIVVPQGATFEIQNKVYVYKVVNGVATSTMLDVEKINNGKEYIVKSGLTPGDVIVAEGVGLMREGTPVTPKAAAAPVAAETVTEAVAEVAPEAVTTQTETQKEK